LDLLDPDGVRVAAVEQHLAGADLVRREVGLVGHERVGDPRLERGVLVHVVGLGLGRHQRHVLARAVLEHERVRAGRAGRVRHRDQRIAGVGQQVVGAAGDDDVDVLELVDDGAPVAGVLQVRGQDDLVDARVGQALGLGVDDPGDVGVEGDVARRGDRRGLRRGGDADDADQLVALLDHDRVGDPSLVAQRLQHGLAAEVRVGRQERHTAALAGDELRQPRRAEVVLVVADRDRVVAERRDRVGVIERAGTRVEALEGRAQVQAGEEVVAGADRHRALVHPRRDPVGRGLRARAVQDGLERVMPP
jgi:hypothetical protein